MPEQKTQPPSEEFLGELKSIAPKRLIKESQADDVADFFLVLAAIFNDLKGLVLFDKLVVDHYRLPGVTEVSVHSGSYGGVRIQMYKLLVATINEIFEFLKVSKSVLDTGEFALILNALPRPRREQWNAIVDIAFDRTPAASDFTKTLIQARNNVAFHYYQSGKNLRKGFIGKFFKKEKNNINKNEDAYYAVGENMGKTRFFYADAALEEYLAMNSVTRELDTKEKHQQLVRTIINDMNATIALLLKEYLRARPYV